MAVVYTILVKGRRGDFLAAYIPPPSPLHPFRVSTLVISRYSSTKKIIYSTVMIEIMTTSCCICAMLTMQSLPAQIQISQNICKHHYFALQSQCMYFRSIAPRNWDHTYHFRAIDFRWETTEQCLKSIILTHRTPPAKKVCTLYSLNYYI